MVTLANLAPQVLHAIPGRVRVHLPAWSGRDPAEIAGRLLREDGIIRVHANGSTRNVLIHFDSQRIAIDRLLGTLTAIQNELAGHGELKPGAGEMLCPKRGMAGPVVRGVTQGAVAHAIVDTFLYAATTSAYAIGWTWVGHIGAVHLVLDLFIWGITLQPVVKELRCRQEEKAARAEVGHGQGPGLQMA